VTAPYRLAGLELASAVVLGRDPATMPLVPATATATPRTVLEGVLFEALQKPPCVIGFSGGRDSSGLLALALHVARVQGLPPPLAATNVFPGDADSNESEWQEMVVRHVGAPDWERLEFTDELDLIGPIAQPALREWGPCFPFNAHFGLPTFSLARHGCHLTGIGGDETFQLSERNHLAAVLTGRERPGRRHLRAAAVATLPAGARRRYYQRDMPDLPWLKAGAGDELKRRMADDHARQPIWNAPDLLDHFWRDRGRLALTATLDAYAASCSTVVVHPFEDPSFLSAVARARPRAGWLRREDAMRELFGDLLPDAVITRRSKARFSQPFFGATSRTFVESWSGQGIDPDLVDAERLLDTWRQPVVDARSYSLVQAAWCASVTSRRDSKSCQEPL
jgi:asparagine synthase (glutamine-hydrolysing)